MENKVYIDQNGFIYMTFIGDQNYDSVNGNMVKGEEFIKKLKQEGKGGIILADVSKVGKQDSGARKAAANFMINAAYDKVGVFGSPLFIKNVGQLIAKAMGKSDKVRFFDAKDEAVGWLRS